MTTSILDFRVSRNDLLNDLLASNEPTDIERFKEIVNAARCAIRAGGKVEFLLTTVGNVPEVTATFSTLIAFDKWLADANADRSALNLDPIPA